MDRREELNKVHSAMGWLAGKIADPEGLNSAECTGLGTIIECLQDRLEKIYTA